MAPLARRIRKSAVRPVPKQDGDVLAEAPAEDPSVAAAAPISGGDGNRPLALAYRARGVRVFPCREDRFGPSEEHPKGDPEAKAPYPGVKWKGSEPGKRTSIEAWWRNWSGALIGVDIGALRILVADVDGTHAIPLWEAYADEHGGSRSSGISRFVAPVPRRAAPRPHPSCGRVPPASGRPSGTGCC